MKLPIFWKADCTWRSYRAIRGEGLKDVLYVCIKGGNIGTEHYFRECQMTRRLAGAWETDAKDLNGSVTDLKKSKNHLKKVEVLMEHYMETDTSCASWNASFERPVVILIPGLIQSTMCFHRRRTLSKEEKNNVWLSQHAVSWTFCCVI